ncbi:MAG: helix-turn-helix domain-containing protein, partial [Candidatus Hodarchaeota archaeon]
MNHLEERLQCTSEELKIYLTLLAFGSSSKNELSTWTTIPEEDVIQKLQSLEEKGFISKFGGVVEKWTPYYPLGNFINQLTSFQTNIEKSVQEVLDTLQREQETLKTQNQEFNESIGTISSTQSELIVKKETSNRELVDKTSSELTQSILDRYMEIQEEIRRNLEKKLSLILNNLREATENIKTNIETSLTKNTENLSITKESVDTIIIEYQTSAISTLDSFKNSLNGLLDSFEQTTSTIGEVFITTGFTSLENVKETTQKSTDLLAANTTKSTEISATNITSFHEKLELSVKGLKEHLNNISLELIEKLMESFSVQIHGFQNTIQDITSTSINKTSEFFTDGETIITDTGDRVSENLTKLINDLQIGLDETVSTSKSSFQSTFEQISSQTDEVFNNSLESLALSETKLKTDLDHRFQEHAEIMKEKIAETFSISSGTVSENLTNVKNGVAENIGHSSQNIESEIQHTKDNLIQDVQNWQDSIITKKTNLEENLNSFRSNLKSKFELEFTNGKNQVTNRITDIIGITGAKVEESSDTLETESKAKSSQEIEKIQQWMNYFSETISNITTSIEDKFNQAEESLELKYRGFQESIKQEKAAIIKRIQEEQEILSGIISDLQGQTKESWENYTQTAIDVMDQNKVTITENLNKTNYDLNSFITNLHDSSKESLDNAVSSNVDILNDLQDETRRISEEGIANLTTTAENQSLSVRQAINQQIQSISEIITAQNDNLNESLSTTSNNMIVSNNDLIEDIKERLKKDFDEQISTIKSKAQKLIESSKMSINESNTGITTSFSKLQEQLNSILQTSEINVNEIVIQLKELNTKLNGIDQNLFAVQNEYLENVSTSLSNFRNSTQELIKSIQTQNFTKLENFQSDS